MWATRNLAGDVNAGLHQSYAAFTRHCAIARRIEGSSAGKGIGEIAAYEEAIIRRLHRKPVIIGHSFGGLLTMILAGRGLAAASVAISPAPFRGVLPLPISALRSASVALRNPANWNRAVPLSYSTSTHQRWGTTSSRTETMCIES
ncbi:MAG: alpha/beta fold hydrolase [Bryobacteraceae bacterium]